jgi:hypothetical protein
MGMIGFVVVGGNKSNLDLIKQVNIWKIKEGSEVTYKPIVNNKTR